MPPLSDHELDLLKTSVAADATNPELRFRLGTVLIDRGDYRAAVLELQRAKASPPRRITAQKLIIEALEATGMNDIAAELRQQLADESGDDDDAGSAPLPVPKPPVRPLDSSSASVVPPKGDAEPDA